jgi:hypothetical protein
MRRRGRAGTSSPSAAALSLVGRGATVVNTSETGGDFDFYISPTGSDSNSGTISSPWAITAINTKRATYAGTRIGLLDGTYSTSGMPNSGGGSNPALMLASGSSGSPTVLQAVNPRMAILDDNHYARPNHGAILGAVDAAAQHIQVKNIKFYRSSQVATFWHRTSGRGVGLKIIGNWFDAGVGHEPDNTPYIYMSAWDDPDISNNLFTNLSNPFPVEDPNYGCMAILSYGCKRNQITENTFDGCVKAHHSKYSGGTPQTDDQEHTFARNYCKDLDIALWGYDNTAQTNQEPVAGPYAASIIENNVFEHCANVHNNPGVYSANAPMIFRNNTMYNASGATSGFNTHARVASNGYRPSVYNNINYNTGTWHEWHALVISLSSGTPQIITFDYNCWGPSSVSFQTHSVIGYPFAAGGSYSTVTSLASWRTVTGQEANSILDDPEFLMTGTDADRFKLNSATSPCWNAGRVGGLSGGATRHIGAWDGVVTQIGKNW